MPNGDEVALIDLPGVYSLSPKSEDEKVAVDVLTGKMPGTAASRRRHPGSEFHQSA